MMNANEIAILVLISKNKPYDEFKNSIRAGWAKIFRENGHPVYFYEGGGDNSLNGDTFELATDDGPKNLARKTKDAFESLIVKHPKLKLVYRTNASSFLDYENFIKFANKIKNPETAYHGIVGKSFLFREFFFKWKFLYCIFSKVKIFPIEFCSGSGFFIGINYVKKIVESNCPCYLVDDVMISKVLKIKPKSQPASLRFDIQEDYKHKVSSIDYSDMLKNNLFHYRFKTDNRDNDVSNLLKFVNKEYRESFCKR